MKPTGVILYGKASYGLRDEGSLVVSVTIDGNQVHGTICLWKSGLNAQTVEELFVIGIFKIEEWKKLTRHSNMSAFSVASSVPWLLSSV